jgi:hypothetical protein
MGDSDQRSVEWRAMLERDLQHYLFENPDVLFPAQTISRKQKEVFIEGRRIDLLFEVDGIQYIVELKRDTIKREHIGQIFEYYGLMRQSHETAKFRIILVAPSIPAYRRISLEEFGIRCVEVPRLPESINERSALVKEAVGHQKRERAQSAFAIDPLSLSRLRFEDFLPPSTSTSLGFSRLMLEDGLPLVQKIFGAYEVKPVKMVRLPSNVLCIPEDDTHPDSRNCRVGVWWAFSFGHSEQLAKNDVPNISVNVLPWGLDFAINAEVQPSQKVMRQRIDRSPERFDQLDLEHGDLQLQAWLKLEHQSYSFHWIPLVRRPKGTWKSRDLLGFYSRSELDFARLRTEWIKWIENQSQELTPIQAGHLERRNRNLNLALRLVRSFEKEDALWNLAYDERKTQLGAEYCKLKPLIDFFQ